jgi:hypothetical protein
MSHFQLAKDPPGRKVFRPRTWKSVSPEFFKRLEASARRISITNRSNMNIEEDWDRKTLRFNVPSQNFYMDGFWLWDEGINARGSALFDQTFAQDQVKAVLQGMWPGDSPSVSYALSGGPYKDQQRDPSMPAPLLKQNAGFVPHIRFTSQEMRAYWPGPAEWGLEPSAGLHTSGITQPPLLARAALHIYETAQDRKKAMAFLREVFPKLAKAHAFLKHVRDREDSGLITIVHRWESGRDNSPVMDAARDRSLKEVAIGPVKQLVHERRRDHVGREQYRPGWEDYYDYIGLIYNFRDAHSWDQVSIVKNSPFAIKDNNTNAIWADANNALSRVASILSENENNPVAKREYGKASEIFCQWCSQSISAIRGTFDRQTAQYASIDLRGTGGWEPIRTESSAGFNAAMVPGLSTEDHAALIFDRITQPDYWTFYPVPTIPTSSRSFDSRNYWRGPVWKGLSNPFIEVGLERLGEKFQELMPFKELSLELHLRGLELVRKAGFSEYCDPQTGILPGDATLQANGGAQERFTPTASSVLVSIRKLRESLGL